MNGFSLATYRRLNMLTTRMGVIASSMNITATVGGGITVNNTTAAGGGVKTFNHTLGASDDFLIVAFSSEKSGEVFTGITAGGNSLTSGIESSTSNRRSRIFYLLDANLPSSGTVEIVISSDDSSSLFAIALSGSGFAQEAPEATNSEDSGGTNVTTQTIDVTTVTDGALVLDCFMGNQSVTVTIIAGPTELQTNNAGGASHGSSYTIKATAGSQDMGWTFASQKYTHTIAAFAPA